MNVTVDIAGEHGQARAVDFGRAAVFADADDFFTDDSYIALFERGGEYVEIGCVF